MANVYYEKDADRSLIAGRKVAVLGYGLQGHAHALLPKRGFASPGAAQAGDGIERCVYDSAEAGVAWLGHWGSCGGRPREC